jgi:amino acid adenylation domain-containing protein
MTTHIRPTNPFIEFKKEDTEGSIPKRFEQQVDKYPDRMAIKTKNGTLTYEALNRAANQLARAILAQYEPSEEPIPLLLKPGAKMVIAILGVLKAGKTWVPLDPSYPYVRLTYILEDSQAKLVLTDNKNFPLANELAQDLYQLLNIDQIDNSFSDENLGLPISGNALAHILYTSGSTGQPKGVVHNHRNVLHYIRVHTNALHICKDDRLSLLSSFVHIAGVTATFRALLNGAALFPFDLMGEGIVNLATWLEREEITIYQSVPTVFRHLIDILNGDTNFPKLRLIHLGGERVTNRDVALYQKWFSPHCLLLNNLGATEVSTYRNYFINKETKISGSVVPVGYAVEDKEVLLLDEAGNDVGFNRIGEIAVRSPYLALGYWRKPEVTRQAFLPDHEDGSKRIYLTGDLGLMRPDGCLEYHGRKDFQVKIRGYRIKVAEIEMALLDHERIKEVAVIARENQNGEQMLVAYLVPAKQPTPTVSELQRFLNKRLPNYMVPSAFVRLDAIPLTPNGKIDRRALPVPGQADLEKSFVAPRTPVEERLASIWTEVLHREPIGIYDNFFELGGHSLLATQVISRISEALSVAIPLRSLFETPTVAGLAEIITLQLTVAHDEMAELLTELEGLSDEEAQQILANG